MPRSARQALAAAFAFWLVLAVAVLLLVPPHGAELRRKRIPLADVLFVGSSARYGYVSGLILAAWCYFLLQWLTLWVFGGGLFPLTAASIPSLMTTFGIPNPANYAPGGWLRPSWVLMYLAPAALFAVNLPIVFWRKKAAPLARKAAVV